MSEAETTTTTMLPLDAERKIQFSHRNLKLTLVLRRLTHQDWKRFFSASRFETERDGKDKIERSGLNCARVELVDDALIGAEGYPTRTGEPLTSLPNWKVAIPAGHKLAAAGLLESVAVDNESVPEIFDPGVREIALQAMWTGGEAGTMNLYKGLVHRFTLPTMAHQKRYIQATAHAVICGGSRQGKTIWSGNRPALVELYDELIQSVEGYSVGSAPLTSVEQIQREMDAAHKVIAAEELFSAPEVGDDEAAA